MNGLELDSLEDLGQRLALRKERLKKLVFLDAPEPVITQEQRMIKDVADELLSRKGKEAEEMRASLGICQN